MTGYEDVDMLNEKNENGYNLDVMRAVIKDKIDNTWNARDIAVVAKQLFGYENKIVRWVDDEGVGIAYNKDNDKIQEHLAYMARRDLV